MWTSGDVAALIGNPFYAITVDPDLTVPHEPFVTEEEWVSANAELISQLGVVPYLRNLLSILQGNYPRGEDD